MLDTTLKQATNILPSKMFPPTHQSIHFWVINKERLPVPFLMLNKCLDIHVKALRVRTLSRLCCLLTSFEQQCQQWEQWMSASNKKDSFKSGLIILHFSKSHFTIPKCIQEYYKRNIHVQSVIETKVLQT
jgi:hypothetical protein